MEVGRISKPLLMCLLFLGLASLSITPVASKSLQALGDQKTYYSPDPHVGTGSTPSPKHSHKHKKPSCSTPSPSYGSGGSYGTPSPSHGSGGSYGTPTPSHGSGGSYGTPTPTPSHGSGGSYGTPTPSHGSGGSYGTPTPTPSHGSGGYYNSPPIVIPPPTTPVIEPPVIPTPTTPVVDPPVIPTPTTPVISTPPSPLIPDPNVPPYSPGTCNYWSSHPGAIAAIFGYWGTIGDFFGAACTSAYGKNLSMHDALTNPRTDGMGALFREGTAAFLNSMACKKYAYTPEQVRHAFAIAVASDKAAGEQAELFKQANEGRLNH